MHTAAAILPLSKKFFNSRASRIIIFFTKIEFIFANCDATVFQTHIESFTTIIFAYVNFSFSISKPMMSTLRKYIFLLRDNNDIYSPTIRLFSATTSCPLAKANGLCPSEQRTTFFLITTFLCCLPVFSREPVYTATAHGTSPRVPHARKTLLQISTCSEDVPSPNSLRRQPPPPSGRSAQKYSFRPLPSAF